MIDPFVTDERSAFRQSVRKLVQNRILPHVNEWDEQGDFPWEIHRLLGSLGCFGFGIDEAYGGLGFDDFFMRVAYADELAQCGANGIWATMGARLIAAPLIHALGSDAVKQEFLPSIVSGVANASLAVTEPSGGSDVATITTTAAKRGGQYILNGEKTFITGGSKSSVYVVAAKTAPGRSGDISLFLVRPETPGFTRLTMGKKMGWWCSDQATLFFDNCELPSEALLGVEGRGFKPLVSNFNRERLLLAAQALGMMKMCLEYSISYAAERITFGKPLLQHQVIRHKISDVSSRIDALNAWLGAIAWSFNEGGNPAEQVSKAKVFASTSLEFAVSQCMQILGGAGYMRGNVVERAFRESKVVAIGGGSEEIMRDLAVRQMGL